MDMTFFMIALYFAAAAASNDDVDSTPWFPFWVLIPIVPAMVAIFKPTATYFGTTLAKGYSYLPQLAATISGLYFDYLSIFLGFIVCAGLVVLRWIIGVFRFYGPVIAEYKGNPYDGVFSTIYTLWIYGVLHQFLFRDYKITVAEPALLLYFLTIHAVFRWVHIHQTAVRRRNAINYAFSSYYKLLRASGKGKRRRVVKKYKNHRLLYIQSFYDSFMNDKPWKEPNACEAVAQAGNSYMDIFSNFARLLTSIDITSDTITPDFLNAIRKFLPKAVHRWFEPALTKFNDSCVEWTGCNIFMLVFLSVCTRFAWNNKDKVNKVGVKATLTRGCMLYVSIRIYGVIDHVAGKFFIPSYKVRDFAQKLLDAPGNYPRSYVVNPAAFNQSWWSRSHDIFSEMPESEREAWRSTMTRIPRPLNPRDLPTDSERPDEEVAEAQSGMKDLRWDNDWLKLPFDSATTGGMSAKLIIVAVIIAIGVSAGLSWDQITENQVMTNIINMTADFKATAYVTSAVTLLNNAINAYHSGSVKAFFGLDTEHDDINRKVKWYVSVDHAAVATGVPDLDGTGTVTSHQYLKFGHDLLKAIDARLKVESLKPTRASRRYFEGKRDIVQRIVTTFTMRLDSLGMRKKPFGVHLSGPSSVGKTIIVSILRKACCEVLKIPADNAYTYAINDSQKHWDGFCSHMHTLLWDDAGSVLASNAVPGFLNDYLTVVGNFNYTPAAADIANKGNGRVNFDLFFVTSNAVDLQASKVMNAPEAVARRMELLIVPQLRSTATRGGVLHPGDTSKAASTKDLDFWTFNVYEPRLTGNVSRTDQIPVTQGSGAASVQHKSVEYEPVANGIDITQLSLLVSGMCGAHHNKQSNVLSTTEKINSARLREDGTLVFQAGSSWTLVGFLREICFATIAVITAFVAFVISDNWVVIREWVLGHISVRMGVCVASIALFKLLRVGYATFSDRWIAILVSFSEAIGWLERFRDVSVDRYNDVSEVLEAAKYYASLRRTGWSWIDYFVSKIRRVPKIPFVYLATALVVTILPVLWVSVATCDAEFGDAPKDESQKAVYGVAARAAGLSQTSISVANPEAVIARFTNSVFYYVCGATTAHATKIATFGSETLCVTTAHGIEFKDGCATLHPVCQQIQGAKGGKLLRMGPIELNPDRCVVMRERDLIFFTASLEHGPDLRKYMVGSKHSSSTDGMVTMISTEYSNHAVPMLRRGTGAVYTDTPLSLKKKQENVFFPVLPRFSTRFYPSTESGDCGSAYFHTDGKRTWFAGIHQAKSSSDLSHCVKVSIEDVEEAWKLLGPAAGILPDAGPGVASASAENGRVHTDLDHIINEFYDRVASIDHRRKVECGALKLSSVFYQANSPDDDISGVLNVAGSLSSSVAQKTKVGIHPYKDELLKATGLPEGLKEPPAPWTRERFYIAKRHFVSNVAAIKDTISARLVSIAIGGFVRDAFARLYHPDMSEVAPITEAQSINGVKEGYLAKYMPGINMSTGAGYPYTCPKNSLIIDHTPGAIRFRDDVNDRTGRILEALANGHRPDVADVMFNAHFKDEPVKPAKNDVAKIRVITASPLSLLIVFRMFYLPILAFISSNRFAFESCPSVIPQSYEWSILRFAVTDEKNPEAYDRKYFDGDYKGWDASLQKVLVMAFFVVAYIIATISGNYSDRDLMIMAGISLVIVECAVNFFGDVILFNAFNPSGQPATAHTNGVVNSVLFRLAWMHAGFLVDDFRHKVKLLVYGDDNWGSIDAEVADRFNKVVLNEAFEPHGIYYTNADKTAGLTPYTELSKIDFLKRTWIWDEALSAYMCPLNKETLGGMCCILRSSPFITRYEVIKACARSLTDESFYYGREFYERVKDSVLRVLNGSTSGDFYAPEYDEIAANFVEKSLYFVKNEDRIMRCLRR